MIMRSNITTLQEKLVNPEKLVHQLILDMDEELGRVRHAVGKAIADEILMKKKSDQAAADIVRWQQRAEDALKRGDEDAAEVALLRKVRAAEQRDRFESDWAMQKAETEKLQRAVSDLEQKIRNAKQKQTLLLARLARAESGQRINNALSRTGGRSALAHFQSLEDRVDRAEAMTAAYDRLDGFDPDEMAIEQQFREKERKARISDELQAMKARLARLDDEAE
jgi:phage shock protein A